MKKMFIAMMAAFSISFLHAAVTNEFDAAKATQAYLRSMNWHVTNDAYRAEWIWFHVPPFVSSNKTALAELDAIMEAKPPLSVIMYDKSVEIYRTLLPRTFAAAKAKYAQSKPHLVAFADGRQENPPPNKVLAAKTVESFVVFSQGYVNGFRARLGNHLSKLIVPALRRHGMAITTGSDGVSPVKAYADRISAALNAPRFDGLNEILEYLDVPARLDLESARVPTSAEAEALAEKIMDGDTDINEPRVNGGLLSAALGVDGFNAFLERYNGGKR